MPPDKGEKPEFEAIRVVARVRPLLKKVRSGNCVNWANFYCNELLFVGRHLSFVGRR